MEGKFITKNHRDKLVDDIKRTHFILGSHSPEITPKLPIGDLSPPAPNFLSSTMKATHFDLGTDKSKPRSEFQSRFPSYETPTSPYLSQDVTSYFKKTHYTLGNYKEPPHRTPAPVAQERVYPSITNEFFKSHHFSYGTDKALLKSSSAQSYNLKKISSLEKQESQQVKSYLIKTNIHLGQDPTDFTSTNKEHFQQTKPKYEKVKGDFMSSCVRLGNDRIKYDTEAGMTGKGEMAKTGLCVDNKEDLRKSHFALGSEKNEYKLSSQELTGNACEKGDDLAGIMKKSNLKLGDNKEKWKTSYGQAHSTSPAPAVRVLVDSQNDKNAHFVLGSRSPNPYLSMHQKDFKGLQSVKGEDLKLGEFLMEHHYLVGSHKESYNNSNGGYGKKLTEYKPNIANAKLKESNMPFGKGNLEIETTNKASFKEIKDVKVFRSKDPGITNNLAGDGKFNWRTENKEKFGWIDPIAEENVRFYLND